MSIPKVLFFLLHHTTDLLILLAVFGVTFFGMFEGLTATQLVAVYLMGILIAPIWALFLAEKNWGLPTNLGSTLVLTGVAYSLLVVVPSEILVVPPLDLVVIFLVGSISHILALQVKELSFKKLFVLTFLRLGLLWLVSIIVVYAGFDTHELVDHFALALLIPLILLTEYIVLKRLESH